MPVTLRSQRVNGKNDHITIRMFPFLFYLEIVNLSYVRQCVVSYVKLLEALTILERKTKENKKTELRILGFIFSRNSNFFKAFLK